MSPRRPPRPDLRCLTALPRSLGLALVLALLATPAAAQAQELPVEPRPDDLLWMVVQEPPLTDERVLTALAFLVDEGEVIAAAGLEPSRLFIAHSAALEAELDPPADLEAAAELLLEAAGLPRGELTSGGCSIWLAPDVATLPGAERLAEALSAQVIDAFFPQGGPPLCAVTSRAREATILVWSAATDPPGLPPRREPRFITLEQPAAPSPPQSGSHGLAAASSTPDTPEAAAMLALAGGLVLGARRLAGRGR